jgi:hypothetical protein
MISVGFIENCMDKSCFDYPVKIQFPVPDNPDCDYCGRRAIVWDVGTDGWSEIEGEAGNVTIVRIGGKRYYQFIITCADQWKNCDCVLEDGVKHSKFKIKRGYTIANLKIAFDCPTAVFEFQPEERQNVIRKQIPCWQCETMVMATIIDKNGKKWYLKQQPLSDLPKRKLFPRCRGSAKTNNAKRPENEQKIYRKYIIKPEMLTSKN